MDKKEVPQDEGIYGQWHGICYAVDENGKYVLSKSAGWEPTNAANRQAWELLEQELAEIAEKVKAGTLSPLAYHMTGHLMDVKILARYAGIARWKVKRHLKPEIFARLDRTVLERYAKIFNVTVEKLTEMPE
jgi:hypothetical protein